MRHVWKRGTRQSYSIMDNTSNPEVNASQAHHISHCRTGSSLQQGWNPGETPEGWFEILHKGENLPYIDDNGVVLEGDALAAANKKLHARMRTLEKFWEENTPVVTSNEFIPVSLAKIYNELGMVVSPPYRWTSHDTLTSEEMIKMGNKVAMEHLIPTYIKTLETINQKTANLSSADLQTQREQILREQRDKVVNLMREMASGLNTHKMGLPNKKFNGDIYENFIAMIPQLRRGLGPSMSAASSERRHGNVAGAL